jgi:hypothetical protein
MTWEQDGVGICRCSVIEDCTITTVNITVRIINFANAAIEMLECAS